MIEWATMAEVARLFGWSESEGGKSIRDLAADTGYSIARVRTLLECADAALRPRGAAQAADQH